MPPQIPHLSAQKKLLKNVTVMSTVALLNELQWALCASEHSEQQTAELRLCMTGSVNGGIWRPGAGQVALTSGPLALNHCNDSPRHWEPVEIISSGPVSAEGRLAHCLLRIASHGRTLSLTCQLWGQGHSWMEYLAKLWGLRTAESIQVQI